MALSYFPFEDQNTNETQYSKLLREAVHTGVGYDADFRVTGNGAGMVVSVAPGIAFLRGHAVISDQAVTVNIPAATSQPRVDGVVLRLDPAANTIVIAVVQGDPGSTSAPPLVQTDAAVYELLLGTVKVGSNVVTITADSVTDRRQFTVDAWATSDDRPTPRGGLVGFNRALGYWEGYEPSIGAWVPVAGRVPSRWSKRRSNTEDDVTAYTATASYSKLVELELPATAPAGRYVLTGIATISGAGGRSGICRFRFSTGTTTGLEQVRGVAERGDAVGNILIAHPLQVDEFYHGGGKLKVVLSVRPSIEIRSFDTGCRVTVEWVGPGPVVA